MEYLIVENGIITNVIVCDEAYANAIGAVPYYDGAKIDDPYNPPKPVVEPDVWDELAEAYRQGVQSAYDE